MYRRERPRGSFVSYMIAIVMAFFIANLLLGNIQPIVEGFKVTGMSSNFNDTIDNLFDYGWTGLGLAILAVLIVAGAYILRQTSIL